MEENLIAQEELTGEMVEVDNFEIIENTELGSVWDRFTGVGYDHAGLMNIILLVGIFIVAKFIFKSFIMSSKRIKSEPWNLAYSISNFSFFLSLALILTSVGYGDVTNSWMEGAAKTATYAAAGLALLIVTGLIFDKLVIHKVNLNKQIADGNIAAGIFDAGNFFSAALIISSALTWQELTGMNAILAVLGIYLVSQVMLMATTFIRGKLFNRGSRNIDFQDEILKNNTAIAIDFAGKRVGTALAIAAATKLLAYQNSMSFSDVIVDWLAVSIILLVLLNVLSWLIAKIVFWKRDFYGDILANNNSAALSDIAIYVSLGLMISQSFY